MWYDTIGHLAALTVAVMYRRYYKYGIFRMACYAEVLGLTLVILAQRTLRRLRVV